MGHRDTGVGHRDTEVGHRDTCNMKVGENTWGRKFYWGWEWERRR